MDIPVMEYISAALRGDIEKAAEISMPCVMCGICTSRCPAELAQYNIAILCRRLTGKHINPVAEHVQQMIAKVNTGYFEGPLKTLREADLETLRRLYTERQMEPHTGDEMWEPEDKRFL